MKNWYDLCFLKKYSTFKEMKESQQKLCVFIHYSNYLYIPKYVSIYVNEISKYFDEVILVTNPRAVKLDLSDLNENVITRLVQNEGYDLGMFYKVLQSIDPSKYSQIACINDSNILFNELQAIFTWNKFNPSDFWGLIDSNEKPWFSTHSDNYHIQSHFIVFNRKAIDKLPEFFDSIQIDLLFKENDPARLRRDVINNWEIGLTQFMIRNGLSTSCYIDSSIYSQLYLSGRQGNVGHKLFPELIQSGYPLIKKKIITHGNWTANFQPARSWKRMIRQYGNLNWEIDLLIEELIQLKYDSGKQPYNQLRRKIQHIYHNLLNKEVA
jgi:lipopolysaccharide biosynthesis protein